MELGLFPLSNSFFLLLVCLGLVVCLYQEYNPKQRKTEKRKRIKAFPSRARPTLVPPYYSGAAPRNTIHMDILAFHRYIPKNVVITSLHEENTRNSIKRVIKVSSAAKSSAAAATSGSPKAESGANSEYALICNKIMFPYMPGCEPDGPNAVDLHTKYPQLTRPDCVRFLVARKGNVKAADDMIVKYLAWRESKFPLKKSELRNAFATRCFFPYGRAKDGSPVVYMRGGLYDNTKATPEQFVLAAGHTIDWSLKNNPGEVNVTVIVHTVHVPDGPNQGADMNFIKLFTQALSDNYPERLKRLILFPFPWYGRAIWGVVKVFVDKRTQDKVMLLSTSSSGIPPEMLQYMDPASMPEFIGGTCKQPIPDLLDTLSD